MVGTAAEVPSAQMHGPVGLRGDRRSDSARRTPQCWARPGTEAAENTRKVAWAHPHLDTHLPCLSAAKRYLWWPSSLTQAPGSTCTLS